MRKLLIFFAFITLFSTFALADIPPVKPKPTPKSSEEQGKEVRGKIFISLNNDKKEPVLTIKPGTLKQLRAAIDEADDARSETALASGNFNFSRMQTIFSGTFLSFALILGGVWMFRRKEKASKLAVSLGALAVFGIGTALVFANTPPPNIVGLTSRIFNKDTKAYGYAKGDVKIVISDNKSERYDIVLEIPKDGSDNNSE